MVSRRAPENSQLGRVDQIFRITRPLQHHIEDNSSTLKFINIDRPNLNEYIFFLVFPKSVHFKAPDSWNITGDMTCVSSVGPARPRVERMHWTNHSFRSSALKSLQTSQRSVSFRAPATYPAFIPWPFDLICFKCLREKKVLTEQIPPMQCLLFLFQ